jgi:hypothetical protein
VSVVDAFCNLHSKRMSPFGARFGPSVRIVAVHKNEKSNRKNRNTRKYFELERFGTSGRIFYPNLSVRLKKVHNFIS